ncbi:hypothetical protein VNI00_017362 [Paramarasmius palmivorus]|uniref:Uncharacterized protein n=1 Tax=Paramarasmius palmivorus TaxID=297713 RepID=A0AAW0B5I8_9AGAR
MLAPTISVSKQSNGAIHVHFLPSETTEDLSQIPPMFSLSVNANAIDRPVTFELGFIPQPACSPKNDEYPNPADTPVSPNKASTILSETESEHILSYTFKPEDTPEDHKQKIMEWVQ